MKMKFKGFDPKAFVMNHIEKVVLALAVVALGAFVVGAVGRESLPKDLAAPELKNKADNANKHIIDSDAKQDPTIKDLVVLAEKKPALYQKRAQRKPIEVAAYAAPVMDAPPFDSVDKRKDPALVNVEDLRATGGSGIFAVDENGPVGPVPPKPLNPLGNKKKKPGLAGTEDDAPKMAANFNPSPTGGIIPPPGSKKKLRYFVTVTGIIPASKQRAAYDAAFARAIKAHTEEDVPTYDHFSVQRAEVSGSDLTNLEWKTVSPKSFNKFRASWVQVPYPELASLEHVTDMFAQPLGPRTDGPWSEYVAHAPTIPLESVRAAAERARGEPPRGGNFDNMGPLGPGRRGPMGPVVRGPGGPGPGPQPVPPAAVRVPKDDAKESDDETFGDQEEQASNEPAMDYELMRKQKTVIASVDGKPIRGDIENLLLRFFDFDVEPGKSYVYRFKLSLDNPNYDLAPKYLKNVDLAKQKFLETDWTQPTPIATIPFADKILVGKAKIEVGKETTVQAVVVKVDDKLGELPLKKDVARGTLLNFKQADVKYPDSRGEILTAQSDFTTDAVVLDVRGGRLLSRKIVKDSPLVEPGEMLLVDRAGNLFAIDEFSDREARSRYEWEAGPSTGTPFGPGPYPGPPIGPGPKPPKPKKPGAKPPAAAAAMRASAP